jgi:hypothetical protein
MGHPNGLLTGYCVAALATVAAVAAGGTRHPVVGLTIITVAAFCVATRMSITQAIAAGAMGWIFYAGFIIGRHAVIAWHGTGTQGWGAVTICLAAGFAGGLAGAMRRKRPGAGESQTRRYGENVVYLAAIRDR